MGIRKLWYSLAAVLIISFAVLLYLGNDIYHKQPPIPLKVVISTGQVLFTGQDIKDGQNVWQSMGGQEVNPFGVTVLMLHPIGQQTGCIANQCIFLIIMRMINLEKITIKFL